MFMFPCCFECHAVHKTSCAERFACLYVSEYMFEYSFLNSFVGLPDYMFVSTQLEEVIIVVGGYDRRNGDEDYDTLDDSTSMLSNGERYDPVANAWSALEHKSEHRSRTPTAENVGMV